MSERVPYYMRYMKKSKIPYYMRYMKGCPDCFIVKEIVYHVDARIEGLQDLINTPCKQRTEDAQDYRLKHELFELTLVRDMIEYLTRGEI